MTRIFNTFEILQNNPDMLKRGIQRIFKQAKYWVNSEGGILNSCHSKFLSMFLLFSFC